MSPSDSDDLARTAAASAAHISASRTSCIRTADQVLASRRVIESSLDLLAATTPSAREQSRSVDDESDG